MIASLIYVSIIYCFKKWALGIWIILMIVLKQSSKMNMLKCVRIASFRLKSAKTPLRRFRRFATPSVATTAAPWATIAYILPPIRAENESMGHGLMGQMGHMGRRSNPSFDPLTH